MKLTENLYINLHQLKIKHEKVEEALKGTSRRENGTLNFKYFQLASEKDKITKEMTDIRRTIYHPDIIA